jgi:drug/metabolite transporter (DMT)-like permease
MLAGIGFIAAAVACFAAMDTTTKVIAATVPVAMAIWTRNLFQLALVSATQLPRRGRALLHTREPGLQVARGLLLLGCSVSAFFGVKAMPVGEFTAIVLITPLVLTLMASLGERVPPLRWLCVAGGFAGALMVIRPDGERFQWASVLPLVIVAVNTGYQWVTGRLAKVEDAGTMQFYTGLTGTLAMTLVLPVAWVSLPWATWALLAALGVLGTLGHLLLIFAYARAPVAMLTPYLYLQIAFATIGGWLVFSHAPDLWSTAGVALIAACGVCGTWLTARDERRPLDTPRTSTCTRT